LKWCQDTTAGHKHVNIENFQGSWYDGMAFCALVHALDPSLIDYDSLSPSNVKHNLTVAFELAEKHFDIPQLLDPEDIMATDALSRPDEQCFMTYLSAFPVAALQKKIKLQQGENDEKVKRAEEEARRKAEEEAARKIKEAEEAARRKAEEEARLREAELAARLRAEEEEKRRKEIGALQAEQERAAREAKEKADKKAAKDARRRAKEEEESRARLEMDDAKRLAEEEAREKAFEEERQRLQEENRRLKASLDEAKAKLIGKLKVTVIQARGLKSKVDPYCTLFLERQKERTRTVKKTKEPKWNADFEFYVSEKDAALEITLFSRSWIFSDDFVGFVSIPVNDLNDGEETNEWYSLKKRKKNEKANGELKLKLLYAKEH